MDFSLIFYAIKDKKKACFFTLDPVAALVYNRTDKKDNNNKKKESVIMTDEIRTTINLCLRLFI